MSDSFEHLYDRARRAFAEGFPEHALVPATEAVKLAPERWDARLLLARVWLAQGGAARAAADARAAIELAKGAMPEESMREAREVLSLAALKTNDLEAAEKELRALADAGHAQSLVRLIALLSDGGRRDDARTLASDGAPRHSSLESALAAVSASLTGEDTLAIDRALGALFAAAGLTDDARARFQRVLAVDPKDPAAIAGLQDLVAVGAAPPDLEARREAALYTRIFANVLTAFGAALSVWSVWRSDLIASYSRFRPEVWTIAGALLAGAGFVLLMWSRSLAEPDR